MKTFILIYLLIGFILHVGVLLVVIALDGRRFRLRDIAKDIDSVMDCGLDEDDYRDMESYIYAICNFVIDIVVWPIALGCGIYVGIQTYKKNIN